MLRERQFYNTIAVLSEAYFKGELLPNSIVKCATGTIIKAGLKECKIEGLGHFWPVIVWDLRPLPPQAEHPEHILQKANTEIMAAAYSPESLAQIETAFMRTLENEHEHPHRITIKMLAVIDALALIHEASKQEVDLVKDIFYSELKEV